jgi:Predicted spermidine synthase with an N-terminal membrane domain
MNNYRRPSPFDPRGTKIAFLVLSAILNIAAGLAFFSLVDWLMLTYGNLMSGIDTTLMLGIFLAALMIGYIMSQVAADGKGMTYGVYGGLAGLVLSVLRIWSSSLLLAALVGLVCVLGGYNGGMLGEGVRRMRAKQKKRR